MTRKEFFTLGSLGVLSLFLPSFLLSNSKKNFTSFDLVTMLKNAKIQRKLKNYNQAKSLYQQILIQFPNEIRAYDGLRKVLLSQKKKEWEVILVFKAALILNPNSMEIKQRLYKEYFNAVLGNKKIKNSINFSGRLLLEIKSKYENFIQSRPNDTNLQQQYAKINRLLGWNADTVKPITNTSLKNFKKDKHREYKKRFDENSLDNLEIRLNNLSAKTYSSDRKAHIRELYKIIIQKYRKINNSSAALAKSIHYFNMIDDRDPLFLKHIRDLAKMGNQYDTLILIETKNHAIKNTFWSGIALFDSLMRKTESSSQSPSNSAISLFTKLEAAAENPSSKLEINLRKIQLALAQNNYPQTKQLLIVQSNNLLGITNSHIIDRVNVLTAKYYAKQSDETNKNLVLAIATNPLSYTNNSDQLIKNIALMNQNRSYNKTIHMEILNKKINNL